MIDSRHYTFGSEQALVDRSTTPPSYIFSFPFLTNPSENALYQTIATEAFSCINSWYSVLANFNDCIAINMTLLRIPEGFYTASSFCTTVQSLVRTVIGGEATVTFSSTTGRVTMASHAANFTVFSNPLTTAIDLLGMEPGITYSGFNTYTFPRFIDLMPIKRVLIASNLPSKNTDVGRNLCFLGSFPVSEPFLQLIEWDQKTFESVLPWETSVSQLRLQFFSQNGDPLEMRSSFCIVLEHNIYMREPPPTYGFYDYLSGFPGLPDLPATLQENEMPEDNPGDDQ